MRWLINRQKNVIFNAYDVLSKFIQQQDRSVKEIPLVEYQQYLTWMLPLRPDGANLDEQYMNLALSHNEKKEIRRQQEEVKVLQKKNKMYLFEQQFWFTFDPEIK